MRLLLSCLRCEWRAECAPPDCLPALREHMGLAHGLEVSPETEHLLRPETVLATAAQQHRRRQNAHNN